MQANSGSPYKPSPLSFGSPRASPFRRPSTPNSSHSGTPGSSPSRGYTPMQSPSKLNQSYTAEEGDATSTKTDPIPQPNFSRELPPSPTKGAQAPGRSSPIVGNRSSGLGVPNDAASKLPAHQAREIREAFQVLDRDNDGKVHKDDVVDVLMNLGQDSSPATIARFFPPGAPSTINFPTFLSTLSQLMAPMSTSQELLNALAAFDDDDNGQIDVAELRDALLHTAPEEGETPLTAEQIDEVFSGFTGRKAFGGRGIKSGMNKRGEVFQYHDFVRSVVGSDNGRREGTAQG